MESARVVLVTNVGQGFGRAVALSYGHAGFDVVCADPDVELASKTAAEVEEVGGQAIPVQVDMTSLLEVRSAFAKVFEIFGVLGGVVHVANQSSNARFDDLSESEFAELLREDVTSTFLLLRTATRLLRTGWVVIVAPPGAPEHPQMAGIQGAIEGLATALAHAPEQPPAALRASDVYYDPERDGGRPRINVVVPSREASDPRSDAALVHAVRFLGSAAAGGMQGSVVPVRLPPPPRVVETLLPEVQAALDDTVRQGDLDDDVDLPFPIDLAEDGEPRDELAAAGLDDGGLQRSEAALRRLEALAEEAQARRNARDDTAARLRWEAADGGGWQR
ncbi:MAG: SDR family NAD(P)-dependent oxidoreductase [Nocardiopsis sp. BM-2018]|nr:MAG: SDR family NAD(P)-dependent oxidoreductase [Nocardiopsis sp. BM-2018]